MGTSTVDLKMSAVHLKMSQQSLRSSPDADTLELASQLLSFSPARVEWPNVKTRGHGLLSKPPFEDESDLSVETKTVQLERSRRQVRLLQWHKRVGGVYRD